MNTPEQQIDDAPEPRRVLSLLIWLVIHVYCGLAVTLGSTPTNVVILYGALSWLIGLPIAVIRGKQSRRKTILIALWIIGPILVNVYANIRGAIHRKEFEERTQEVVELCKKYGGDKVYRTVDNVEGVFQITARFSSRELLLTDQNAEHPWATAQGDDADMSSYVNGFGDYWFIEQQPNYGQSGPPYRRTYLKVNEGDGKPPLIGDTKLVNQLHSRYGYELEDRTTPELRAKWIGGGAIRIIDLQTKEVIAERVGYYRAMGGSAGLRWAAGRATMDLCNFKFGIGPFLTSVLKPINRAPSAEELRSIAED